MDQQSSSHSGSDAEPQYVGFWARVLATIIDSIWISVILALVVAAVFGGDYIETLMTPPAGSAGMVAGAHPNPALSFLLQLLLPALLIVAFWVYRSATPGKMVISAEIVDAKTLGKPTTGQLIVRYIGYYLSSLVFFLGFLWVAFDKRKQGWHDKIAGTVVIKKQAP